MDNDRPSFKNRLLACLTPADLGSVHTYLEPVALPRLFYLEKANAPITHLYFPDCGIASTVALIGEKREIEVAVTGREGVTGTAVLLGTDRTPHDCYMQMAGRGHRIHSDHMLRLLAQSRTLLTSMLAFVNAHLIQQEATAHVNGTVKLQERLARWLLMVHDRSDDDTFPITHDYLSVMLGVRRPGITVALHIFEGEGFIRANRGRITILNRKALLDVAEGSYGVPEREYTRLIGAELART